MHLSTTKNSKKKFTEQKLAMKWTRVAIAVLVVLSLLGQITEGGKLKKLIAASVLAGALKPRFVPLPIPIPFKIKIKKGEKIVPYPVKSYGGGGYGGGGFGDGGYGGGGGFGGGGGGYGGGGGGYGGGGGGYGGGGGGYGGGGNDMW
ncbi:hypothetical protein NPIL_339831 [Nephila pilipes]|uniref:Uncharacterized protein n=1 Tax=Nephila pilipes TaxID=299642 RepID=A0A8X6MLN3_NEPPI|nr:hypothetical protein NPIL_339831 [Nephila pilipes]